MSSIPANRVEKFPVRYSETGRDGRLKMRPFFDYAQEIAARHAEEIGVGMSYLKEHRLGWMLSRVRFAFTGELPRYGENIGLETYPLALERLFAIREFIYANAEGKRWATGSSQWIVVDLERLRPVSPAKVFPALWPDNSMRERFFDKLDKFPLPENWQMLGKFVVPESGIDVNCHLNNAEYAALVQDILYVWGKTFADLAELQINFLHGVATGDEVEYFGKMNENGFVCGGRSELNAVFEAEGIWKK